MDSIGASLYFRQDKVVSRKPALDLYIDRKEKTHENISRSEHTFRPHCLAL